jgi:hypothetical protein
LRSFNGSAKTSFIVRRCGCVIVTIDPVFRYAVRVSLGTELFGIRRGIWSAWDSMAHVSLVSAIENRYDLQFDATDAMKMDRRANCLIVVTERLRGA